MEDLELVKLSIEAKKNAFVPFSNFKVGAALLTKTGEVFKGANVECSSYGMTICAERCALVKAVSEGYTEFSKIAIVGGMNDELTYTTPCGACRQFLADFNLDLEVLMGYKEGDEIKIKKMKLKELLPETFESNEDGTFGVSK